MTHGHELVHVEGRRRVALRPGRVACPAADGMRALPARRGDAVVAVDRAVAGAGAVMPYATGSSARLTAVTKDRPVDAVIMALVDSFDIDGRVSRLA